MQRSALFAALVSCSLILAGCLGDDSAEKPAPADDHAGHEGHRMAPPSDEDHGDDTPQAPVPNTPPSAGIDADNLSAEAPVNITFTLEGEDADGDPLTWTIDADGDGTPDGEGDTLPATWSFRYETAGNYTATLIVSDGNDSTDANVTVHLSAPAPASALPEPLVFTGTTTGTWVGLSDVGGPEYAGTNASHTFNFTDAIAAVQNFTVTVLGTNDGAFDLDFEIYAPDGTQVVRQANFNDPIDESFGVTNPSQEEPIVIDDLTFLRMPGEWTLVVQPGAAYEGDYEATITFG